MRKLILLFVTTFSLLVVAAPLARGEPQISVVAPSSLQEQNDDHVGRLSWTASNDPSVVGYKVSWWPNGSSTRKVFWTVFTEGNIQPLNDGVVYQAQVEAVDGNGTLSAAVGPISAQTDPTRVNALRQTMNAQFDDFNVVGPINPLDWFITADGQTGGVAHPPGEMAPPFSNSGTGVFPMTDQNHMHMYISGDNEPGLVTMRALHPFDFTNRTGTIGFDFDWGQLLLKDGAIANNLRWFLSVSPTPVDDANSSADGGRVLPADQLRISMTFNSVSLDVFHNGNSVKHVEATPGFSRAINVRKPSRLQLSQSTADLFIDNVNVLHATGLNLPFSVGYITSQQWDYDLQGSHMQARLTHWDNIGFDAPAGYNAPVIHVYDDGGGLMGNLLTLQDPAFVNPNHVGDIINVPDDITGVTSAQVYLDFVAEQYPGATVSLNGVSAPIPTYPYGDNLEEDTRFVSFPSTAVHHGANTVSVSVAGCNCVVRMNKIHLELQYPHGSSAPYTPPGGLPSGDVPQQASLGPQPIFGAQFPVSGSTLTGSVPVEIRADGGPTLLATGHIDAITAVGLAVDGNVVLKQTLSGPTTKTDQTLQLDTTQLTNGSHRLTGVAYGIDGGALTTDAPLMSTPDFPQDLARTVTISNAAPVPTSTPTSTPLPTSTPTPVATNTPTATSTVVPAATDTPTSTSTPAATATPVPSTCQVLALVNGQTQAFDRPASFCTNQP